MYYQNIKQLTKANSDFRKVLYTSQHAQVVAMNLNPGRTSGEEIDPLHDRIFLIMAGLAEAVVGGLAFQVSADDLVVVPAGMKHNFHCLGGQPLKVCVIYSPAALADGTIQASKFQPKSVAVKKWVPNNSDSLLTKTAH